MSHFVTNKNGAFVLNAYTKKRIPKSVAIDLTTSDGLVRTWDATGLYEWFFKRGNSELEGFISSLTQSERRRIRHLNSMFMRLQRRKDILKKRPVVKGTTYLNNVKTHTLLIIDTILSLLAAILLAYVSILLIRWFGSTTFAILTAGWNPVVGGKVLVATAGAIQLRRLGHRMTGGITQRAMDTAERKLENYIDSIPFDETDVHVLAYVFRRYANSGMNITSVLNTSARNKDKRILSIVKKMQSVGYLQGINRKKN
jgi:hypothetical protein